MVGACFVHEQESDRQLRCCCPSCPMSSVPCCLSSDTGDQVSLMTTYRAQRAVYIRPAVQLDCWRNGQAGGVPASIFVGEAGANNEEATKRLTAQI